MNEKMIKKDKKKKQVSKKETNEMWESRGKGDCKKREKKENIYIVNLL